MTDDVQFVTIHGHRRAFVKRGSGPALLLMHGVGCDHTTWEPVLADLARRYTVIAPDLLGHGLSDKPRADYSVGGYANGMRDLLSHLEIPRATVVGHSFGGGVALQFAYQFPELLERLILVGPGGFGPDVTPVIRAMTLPGAHQVTGLLTLPVLRQVSVGVLNALAQTGIPQARDLDEVATILDSFADPRTRTAIRHVLRAVVDWRGQIIALSDRAYLLDHVPTCIIWGRNDMAIPVTHAGSAAALLPNARVEIIPNAGHLPFRDHPQRFTNIVRDFIRRTEPAVYDEEHWRALIRAGGEHLAQAEAGQSPIAPLSVVPSA